jgi:hypothetical protein
MTRKGKLPADKSGTPYLYRSAEINRADARDEDRSMPMVLATSDPIPTYDLLRGEVIDEVLHFDGMQMPAQVPMVDSHDRGTVRAVLGSIRNLEVRGDQLVGRAYFASDAESQRAYQNYKDGHLTDFSVGASIRATEYKDGKRHVVSSVLREGSAVVAGQDPGAKVISDALRAYTDPEEMREEMIAAKLRELMVKRGMDENATDAEMIELAEVQLTTTATNEAQTEATTVVTSDEVAAPEVAHVATDDAEEKDELEMAATEETAAAVAAERKRVTEVTDICRKHDADDICRTAIDNDWSAERTALEILKRSQAEKTADGPTGNAPPRIESGASEREKFFAAAVAGVTRRLADTNQINPDKVATDKLEREAVERNEQLKQQISRSDSGADELRFVPLPDLARMFLERSGERVSNLPKTEIVRRAMAQREFLERSDQASNTTGTFSNLLLDAARKTLLAGYDEAPATYTEWVRMAPSASDFKQLNRIRFGELADPEVVPENMPYSEKSTSDAKESYAVEKHGEIFSISFEAVVNDDLNAITRIPQMQGSAMRRKVNKTCYGVLTANEALSDGVALFHATSHGANLDATALAESALDVGFTVMMNQTGLSGSGTPLNIMPRFLIVPPNLAATAYRLTGGAVVPETVGNVALYGPGGPRPLRVVVEAQLTSNSTTGWYLAADNSIVDTVEITFLQGEESPVLSREEGFSTDTLKYKIRQTFAAKAIDYRGLYQGNS